MTDVVSMVDEYNVLVQRRMQQQFWQFFNEIQKTVSLKSLEFYLVCLDLKYKNLSHILRTKSSIRKYCVKKIKEGKLQHIKIFNKKAIYGKNGVNFFDELMKAELLIQYEDGTFDVNLPDITLLEYGVPYEYGIGRIKFDEGLFCAMLKKALYCEDLRELYKIRKTNYPLYYLDLAKTTVIKKDLNREELTDVEKERLAKQIKLLKYQTGEINFEELTGKKEATTFMGCAKQWMEIMMC